MKGNKTYFLLLSLLFIGGLCTGCAQAPEKVLENKKEYGSNKQVGVSQISWCSIEELRGSSMDDIIQQHGNLSLPDQVDFSSIQDVHELELKFPDHYTQRKQEFAELFGLGTGLRWEERGVKSKKYRLAEYDSQEKKEYLCIEDNGFVSFDSPDCYEISEGEHPISQKIYLKRGDAADINVNLDGKNVSLLEEINWANTKINQIMTLDSAFDFDIRTIYIRKNNADTQRVSMSAWMRYHGMPLDFFGGGMEDVGNYSRVNYTDNILQVEMLRDEEFAFLVNQRSFEVSHEKPVEQVIDLQSAVNIAEEKMSGFHRIAIAEIEAMYTLIPQYDYKVKDAYYAMGGNLVKTRPVYSFIIKYDDDACDKGVNEAYDLCYINVDMLTGEVTDNLEESGYGGY